MIKAQFGKPGLAGVLEPPEVAALRDPVFVIAVDRQRVGVGAPLLPRLADLLDLSFDEMLVGQPAPYRPGRRGPPSHLAQHFDRIAQLPKAKQRFVVEMIDSVIAKAQLEAQQAT